MPELKQLRNRRRRNDPTTAFVLSGGGNQGVAQVGMLRALVERGILPDVIIGTSAGALNGAALSDDPTLEGLDHLQEVWASLTAAEIFPGGRMSRIWSIASRQNHLFSNTGLEHVIERASRTETFEELQIPLRVIACDLYSGEEVVLAHGDLKTALLASSALPGVYPPIVHAGHTLIDGGVVNAVPLWHALSGPVDRVFVLNVSAAGVGARTANSQLDVVMSAFAIARHQRYKLELQHTDRHDAEVIVLPRPTDPREQYDFAGGEKLIQTAHDMVSDFLDHPDRNERPKRRFRLFRVA